MTDSKMFLERCICFCCQLRNRSRQSIVPNAQPQTQSLSKSSMKKSDISKSALFLLYVKSIDSLFRSIVFCDYHSIMV